MENILRLLLLSMSFRKALQYLVDSFLTELAGFTLFFDWSAFGPVFSNRYENS